MHRWRPGKIGRGDIWLMAFAGFVAGPDHAAPVLVAFCILCVLTAGAYSLARGKGFFRSMFPAALPGMATAALALALRLWEAGIWQAAWELADAPGQGGVMLLSAVATSLTAVAAIAWRGP